MQNNYKLRYFEFTCYLLGSKWGFSDSSPLLFFGVLDPISLVFYDTNRRRRREAALQRASFSPTGRSTRSLRVPTRPPCSLRSNRQTTSRFLTKTVFRVCKASTPLPPPMISCRRVNMGAIQFRHLSPSLDIRATPKDPLPSRSILMSLQIDVNSWTHGSASPIPRCPLPPRRWRLRKCRIRAVLTPLLPFLARMTRWGVVLTTTIDILPVVFEPMWSPNCNYRLFVIRSVDLVNKGCWIFHN